MQFKDELKPVSGKAPQWETSKDRRNESDVARILESRWDCRLHKMPKSYRLDYFATRDRNPVAFIEVKCRTHSFNQFPTLILSLGKYLSAQSISSATGIPSLLVARFPDSLAYVSLMNDFPISMGGRTATARDERDFEPVIEIPTERMVKLYGSNNASLA